MIELTGNNVVLVVIVAVIALAALVVAGILVREVLAASEAMATDFAALVETGDGLDRVKPFSARER